MNLPCSRASYLTYVPRKPDETELYKIIQENWNTFLSHVEQGGRTLPNYVIKEFAEYLRCGILAYGFLRVCCEDCHKEFLVGFSCKRRGFCPSCGGRRMSETAAHLVDHVIPEVPVRQWVLTVPIQLRYWLTTNPKLQSKILKIVIRVINNYYKKSAEKNKNIKNGKTGSVTLIQRFGSALNLNIHFHVLFLDGVFEGEIFHKAESLKNEEVEYFIKRISQRIIRYLRKKGYLRDESVPEFEEDAMNTCIASSVGQTIAFGERSGKPVRKIGSGFGYEDEMPVPKGNRCSAINGFSLHANTWIGANQRDPGRGLLEQLCRYICRPAIALERLSRTFEGNVLYKLKTPFPNGTTHVLFSPIEFIEKLVALVPKPRANLIRYHGVLAPHAAIREKIIPKPKEKVEGQGKDTEKAVNNSVRIRWALLLKRVFQIDVETCSACGGRVRIIAAITQADVIRKILTHLKLSADPPPLHPPKYLPFHSDFLD
jgi:hypothetical protein